MLDRSVFFRPIAHRGLHHLASSVVENTAPAFEAAIAKDYGIECDLRPAADGTPMVFHDLPLGRLVEARGRITDLKPIELGKLVYKADPKTRILTFADFLDLVAGKVPLLVEVKSEWDAPDEAFIKGIAKQAKRYKGPLALMSFDPAMIAGLKPLVPMVTRGIVSGLYKGDGWWLDKLEPERAYRLSHMIESGPAEPHFFAYHVKSLPTPVTQFLREGLGLPLFTWTVRTQSDLAVAARYADAPIFESLEL